MIRLVHRHSKIITYVFLFIAFCFMFSGVGIDILHGGRNAQQDYAIQVNDTKISLAEVARTKENLTQQYRRMFGENFEAFAKSLNLNLNKQALDSLVDSTLLSQEATEWGFAGNEDAVKKYLVTKVFAGREISEDAVRSLLRNIGMNYRQFSKQVQEEISRQALANILRDVSFVTESEVESQYIKQETSYDILAASVAFDSLVSKVQDPSEEALKKLYESTATNYEVPARVTYEYLTFQPQNFKQEVPVSPQDIEFFYSENQIRFKTPEQLKVRVIKLLYPKQNDPSAMAAVKTKAQSVLEEARSGKAFEELVRKYSDDLPSKLAGGDRGWVSRGSGSKAFEQVVFKTPVGSVADLVEEDFGFEIVKVEGRTEPGVKPLDQVRAEIENTLRSQEAPSYAAAKAREVVELAKKEVTSVAEIAKRLNLPAPKSSVLAQQGDTPDPLLRELTQRAMTIPAAERLVATVIDVGDTSVALQIREFKEPTTQTFEQARDKVLAAYKKDEARKQGEKTGQEILQIAQGDPTKLEREATSRGFTLSAPFTISRASPSNSAFSGMTQEMLTDVFSSSKAPRALSKAYRSPQGISVAVVRKVTIPEISSAVKGAALDKYRTAAGQQNMQETLAITLALLKSRSTIDIDQQLLAQ
jgi:peptidyl-prolyl cis-trans isomerase D